MSIGTREARDNSQCAGFAGSICSKAMAHVWLQLYNNGVSVKYTKPVFVSDLKHYTCVVRIVSQIAFGPRVGHDLPSILGAVL